MKEVRYSTKAKKDLKRYRHDMEKMKELFHVLLTTSNQITNNIFYGQRPHFLP